MPNGHGDHHDTGWRSVPPVPTLGELRRRGDPRVKEWDDLFEKRKQEMNHGLDGKPERLGSREPVG